MHVYPLFAVAASLGAVLLLALPGASYPDIRNTKHNLAQRNGRVVDEEAVCVFCHTPESATVASMAPVWNRSNGNGPYNTYDDIGRLGFRGSRAVGSSSLACMSCHDSSQALGVMSFRYDHPVGVPYRGDYPGHQPFIGSGISRMPNVPGPPRSTTGHFRPALGGTVENRRVFWVPTAPGGGVSRQRTDLPLYARDSGAGEVPYIECTSCHDPHSENRTFLRTNGSSGLCLTCHDN